ncbi:hypothetical protein KY290_010927 [Solanum tuberosum]|uniref:Reverse transcriptase domain-containing protein n=1 Tax=Solanum tuberosum TaxID=4113 RepID=A0ABQ7W155_SOLTU|nr:hypothetical protein KY290_010927 [Solanum tuberosum]
MVIWNKVDIAKTYWNLTHKEDKLWIRWINEYYTEEKGLRILVFPLRHVDHPKDLRRQGGCSTDTYYPRHNMGTTHGMGAKECKGKNDESSGL